MSKINMIEIMLDSVLILRQSKYYIYLFDEDNNLQVKETGSVKLTIGG